MSGPVASRVETVRVGTVARAHDRLCTCGDWTGKTRASVQVPLAVAAMTLRRHHLELVTVADARALLRECDAW